MVSVGNEENMHNSYFISLSERTSCHCQQQQRQMNLIAKKDYLFKKAKGEPPKTGGHWSDRTDHEA